MYVFTSSKITLKHQIIVLDKYSYVCKMIDLKQLLVIFMFG